MSRGLGEERWKIQANVVCERMAKNSVINQEKNDISRQLIGDISYNHFDKDGGLIDCKWNRQLMSLNIDEIKRIPEVIEMDNQRLMGKKMEV